MHFSDDWTSGAFATYFLLNNNADITALNQKLDNLIAANHKADPGEKSQVQLQALKDVHFYSNDIEGNSGKKGNISYIYVFLIVACFIIFIACINYMNLSTARFTNRGKEIAVRKVCRRIENNARKTISCRSIAGNYSFGFSFACARIFFITCF